MAACPNCGRQTLRTKDWACQWCGYPLISRAFKAIDKTFKELQEERLQAATQVAPEMDAEEAETPEFVEEIEEEKEPGPQPEDKRKRKPEKKKEKPEKQKFSLFRSSPPKRPQPQPEPPPSVSYPEHRPEPVPRPVSRPEPRPEPPPAPKPVVPVYRPEPRPEPPPQPKPQPAVKPVYQPAPEPVVVKPVAPPPPPPPPPVPEPPRAKPEIIVEAPPPYISSVKMEDIKEGMEISTDDLDALFKADKSGTNNRMTGKTIVLKGVVEKVFIREHLDIRYIMLTGKRKLSWSDRCTFNPDDAAKANRLNEGDEVMVRAKYDGYGKNIIFKDCQIV
jgi:hypothetical protein